MSYALPNNVTIRFYRDARCDWRILQATVDVIDGVATLDRPAPSKHWKMEANLSTASAWQLRDSTGRVLV